LKTSAKLRLKFESERARKSLLEVLAPDNRNLPKGLVLRVSDARRSAAFEVDSQSPSTSLSTILALLRDVALFQEVWLLSHGEGGRGHRPDSS
jgi:hypothetical protein